jgi:hypothetical protein
METFSCGVVERTLVEAPSFMFGTSSRLTPHDDI